MGVPITSSGKASNISVVGPAKRREFTQEKTKADVYFRLWKSAFKFQSCG